MGSPHPGSHSDPPGDSTAPKDTHDVEEREALADDREAELDARQNLIVADESARDARKQRHRDIVGKAEERDVQADARDSVAERRDRDASLAGFLNVNDNNFENDLRERRSAALDRSQSKGDRSLAASDRSEMADLDPRDDETSEEQI
jgi:hypothetical protein